MVGEGGHVVRERAHDRRGLVVVQTHRQFQVLHIAFKLKIENILQSNLCIGNSGNFAQSVTSYKK